MNIQNRHYVTIKNDILCEMINKINWRELNWNKIYDYSWTIGFSILIWSLPWVFEIKGATQIVIYTFSAIGATIGLFANLLLSKRNKNHIFLTLTSLVIYAIISMLTGAWFEGGANLLIPVPILIFAIFKWRRHTEQDGKVHPNIMSKKGRFVYLPLTTIAFTFMFFGLSVLVTHLSTGLAGEAVEFLFDFFDGSGAALTTVSMFLILNRYKEFAVLNAINYINVMLVWTFYIATEITAGSVPSPHAMVSVVSSLAFTIQMIYSSFAWTSAEKLEMEMINEIEELVVEEEEKIEERKEKKVAKKKTFRIFDSRALIKLKQKRHSYMSVFFY